MTAPKLTDAEALAVLDALHPVCPKPVRDHFAALTYARAAVEASKAEAVEGGRRYGHYGDQVRALPPESGGQGDLVEEGLRYFELSSDAGDKRYVAAIRAALTHPPAHPSAAVTEAMVTDALCAFYCEPPTDPDGGDSFDASSRLRMRRTITAALSQGGKP